MSFVIYDVETTGTSARFDQILQFAAIRTDANLEIVEEFATQSRLLPHIIPAPEALLVNRLTIEEILDTRRKSHFEMMREIWRCVGGWGPAAFLGYNSVRFDEEFLRHAFYQCLLPPYLTNTLGNTRADVLSLMRACAGLHPDVLNVPIGANGKPTFALHALAKANGFRSARAHEAMIDARATLHLCRHVAEHAGDLWSRFLRYGQKAAAADFIKNESAFLVFEPHAEAHRFVVGYIDESQKRPNNHFCLNLEYDLDDLTALSDAELFAHLENSYHLIRRVRVNASPMLCSLDEAPSMPLPLEEYAERGSRLQANCFLRDRLRAISDVLLASFPPSQHVEQQLYEKGFWPDEDRNTLMVYHDAAWTERIAIAKSLHDDRLRRLAQRIAFFERPDFLDGKQRGRLNAEMQKRIVVETGGESPWLTIPQAIRTIDRLMLTADRDDQPRLSQYRMYLSERLQAG